MNEEQQEVERLINAVLEGKRSGYRVTWTPTSFSMECTFLSSIEQRPTEERRAGAAYALRMAMSQADKLQGFMVFWDGSSTVTMELTIVHPVQHLNMTLQV